MASVHRRTRRVASGGASLVHHGTSLGELGTCSFCILDGCPISSLSFSTGTAPCFCCIWSDKQNLLICIPSVFWLQVPKLEKSSFCSSFLDDSSFSHTVVTPVTGWRGVTREQFSLKSFKQNMSFLITMPELSPMRPVGSDGHTCRIR